MHRNSALLPLMAVWLLTQTTVPYAVLGYELISSSNAAVVKQWQAGVLCGAATGTDCTTHKQKMAARWQSLLLNSSSAAWPTVNATTAAGAKFFIVARHLKPLECNIQFAEAYCNNKGAVLAYWNTQQEYNAVAKLTLGLAKQSKDQWHVYIGVVQLPAAKEPKAGWVWVHNSAAASVPWAQNEPNQHNGANIKGHTEDCAVLATYHGQKATKLVDDFPCSYADDKGNWLAGGWNPKLSVACRIV
eukprot:GHRR01020376.1.p1 GENE.GHRR01020376.1~~GHRR01020376.1.p1  ORF type:complete len:245 (+),score=81.13 GHRR01020376.1:255-989(+)